MTDKEILEMLSSLNYASLFITSNGQRTKFGSGELAWRRDLKKANEQQRRELSEKLARWTERSAS